MTREEMREKIVEILRRMRQAGESHEMCARWIIEEVTSPLLLQLEEAERDAADSAYAFEQVREFLAEAKRERDKALYFNKRMEEARAQQPDWEKLWEEQANRADEEEARVVTNEEKILAELAVIRPYVSGIPLIGAAIENLHHEIRAMRAAINDMAGAERITERDEP